MPTMREASRQNWNGNTIDHINAGSLQRIADATEIMAQNFVTLQNDRDWYKGRTNELTDANVRLHRRIAALQGVITRMKHKAGGNWKPVPQKP